MGTRFPMWRWIAIATVGSVAVIAIIWGRTSAVNFTVPVEISGPDLRNAAAEYEQLYGEPASLYDALSWLAEQQVVAGQWDDALRSFAAIPIDTPRYGRSARYQEGQIALRLKQAVRAERCLRELISAEEQAATLPREQLLDARARLRFLLEVQLRFEERAELLRGVVARGEAEPFELAAYCFPTLLRWWGSEAFQWLDGFAANDPKDRAIRVAMARFRTEQGRLKEADEILSPLLAEDPGNRAGLAARLTLLREVGDQPALDRWADELPQEQPDDPWTLRVWRGRVARMKGDTATARRVLLDLLDVVPTHAESWRELVDVARLDGDDDLARKAGDRVRELGSISNRLGVVTTRPGEAWAWIDLVEASDRAGFVDEARLLAAFALKLVPDSAPMKKIASTSFPRPTFARSLPAGTKVSRTNDAAPAAIVRSPRSTGSTAAKLQFRDATEEVGLAFTRYDDIGDLRRVHEGLGGGVAAVDYDLNGRPDLFFTDGCRLPRRLADRQHANTLWAASTDGRYRNVSALAGVGESGYFTGVVEGDFDSDGFPDLCVTAYRGCSLWRNCGDGTFERIALPTETWRDLWSTSAACFDAENDGDLDLFVATYILAEDDPPLLCPNPESPVGRISCPPTYFPSQRDVFLLNDGQGGFEEATVSANLAGIDGKGLGAVAFDADQDGRLDLYVANDGTPCFLHHNRSEIAGAVAVPRFEDIGPLSGTALDGAGVATAAMGVTAGDYDRDGWIDLAKANFLLEPITLYRNDTGLSFSDVSAVTGVSPPSRQTLGFGLEFFDADNDGWLDLIAANGHIEDRTWTGVEPYRMPPHLFHNRRDGTFVDLAPSLGGYFTSRWIARGVAVADLNRDGRLDLAVSHQLDRSVVLLNETEGATPAWTFRCVGVGRSNRMGIGARVSATGVEPVLMREIPGGGSYQSSSAREAHLAGLGEGAVDADFQIRWPSGELESVSGIPPGYYVVVEGRGPTRIP